jgi:hypothetical protein
VDAEMKLRVDVRVRMLRRGFELGKTVLLASLRGL